MPFHEVVIRLLSSGATLDVSKVKSGDASDLYAEIVGKSRLVFGLSLGVAITWVEALEKIMVSAR